MNIKNISNSPLFTKPYGATHTDKSGKYFFNVFDGAVDFWNDFDEEWIDSMMDVKDLVEL